MKLFLVFKEGVYRHECGGVFSTLEKAETAAKDFLSGEIDDYHKYDIVPFDLDVQTLQNIVTKSQINNTGEYYINSGELIEPDSIVIFRRKQGVLLSFNLT